MILLSQIPVLASETPLTMASLFSEPTTEKPSPYDWIKQEQISVKKDQVVIDLKGAVLARFVNTNSMDPILDEHATGIEIVPDSLTDIHIGDIVSYKSNDSEVIIHRVVFIGVDNKGWYALMKGDNNDARDPERIRFEQIQRVLVGVIY